MLKVGNGGMTKDESRTHMSLWAILAAPLLAGNDLSNMHAETIELLTNREVVAIDQDSAGLQGDRVSAEGPIEIWARPLAGGSKAVGVFNRHHRTSMTVQVDLRQLGFSKPVGVRDVWQAKDLGQVNGTFRVEMPVHGVVLLRVTQ